MHGLSSLRAIATEKGSLTQTLVLGQCGIQVPPRSAESIPTLKNRESIHFDFLLRGFVEKESIHDS